MTTQTITTGPGRFHLPGLRCVEERWPGIAQVSDGAGPLLATPCTSPLTEDEARRLNDSVPERVLQPDCPDDEGRFLGYAWE